MTDPSHTLNGLGSGQDQGDASSSRGRSAALRVEPAAQSQTKPAASIAELIALAERVEASGGRDRELDHRIALAKQGGALGSYPTAEAWIAAATADNWNSLKFTASVDAAMTLVPEGIGGDGLAVMIRRSWRGHASVKLLDTLGGQEWDGSSASIALALTAAALRARAALTLASGAPK